MNDEQILKLSDILERNSKAKLNNLNSILKFKHIFDEMKSIL